MTTTNELDKLKLRQICFIFLAFTPVTKIALLPSVLAGFCEETLWISTLLSFSLDVGVLLIFLRLSVKRRGETAFSIAEKTFSKPVARIFSFLYGAYFMLKATVPLLEQQDYVHNTLYEISPSIFIFLPFFILSFYLSLKGLKIIGRCADASIWLTAVGFIMVFLLAIPKVDYTNILPIIQKPTYKPVIGSLRSVIWFSDSVYCLLFLGHFKTEKGQTLKLTLSYIAVAVVVTFFMVTFYASFTSIAKTRFFATPELTIYSLAITNSARFDYIAIFILMFSQVFAIILPIFLATKCFKKAFNLKSALVPAIVVNAVLATFTVVFTGKLFAVLAVISNYLSYAFIFFGYVVPVMLLFVPKVKNSENESQT